MTSGKNKLIALFAVAIVVIAGVVIFTADNSKDDGDFTVTDMRGRIVSIPSNVDKIVCLSAGSLRLVEYLGAADMVVGIDKEDSNVSKPTYYKGTYHIAFDVKGIAKVTRRTSKRSKIQVHKSSSHPRRMCPNSMTSKIRQESLL